MTGQEDSMTVTIAQDDWKKVLAEVVGTFFFFFIGIGAVAWLPRQEIPALNIFFVAIAHGLALSLAISALGHVSGGHFNPAVTIGLAVGRKISPVLSVLYILGQLVGGVLASLAVAVVMSNTVVANGTPAVDVNSINIGQAILLEGILTFFLLLAVFGTAVDPRAPKVGGFGIGLTVFVGILVAAPLTGGAFNPARALAPAIVSGKFGADWYVYWVGPILGAVVAALLYNWVFMPRPEEPVVSAPAITDQPLEPPLSEPGLLKDS
jgi:MIP family channel proteins